MSLIDRHLPRTKRGVSSETPLFDNPRDESFHKLRASGQLETLEAKILEIIAAEGPVTKQEICIRHGFKMETVCGRVGSLLSGAYITEAGKKINGKTGRKNTSYQAAN